MIIPRVMPCLLVENDRLVKTIKFKSPSYVGDPVNAVKIYNEKEVDELIILDITATIEKRKPNFNLIREIADECFMPVCYGGGINSIEEMNKIFKLGIEKISLNTTVFKDFDILSIGSTNFGRQSIVVSIDVKKSLLGKYVVFTQSGKTNTGIHPVDYAQLAEEKGAGEILLNSIDRDGTWSGYDLKLIKLVCSAVSIPVIVCGGAGSLEDFANAVINSGASACAAGSMVVYQGQNLGVLINFPSRHELTNIFEKKNYA